MGKCKYNFEFKKQLVDEYLNGNLGGNSLAKKHGVPNSVLWRWIKAYQAFGDDGLKISPQKNFYSFEKKLSVVESFLSSKISYQEFALQEGRISPCLIANWVNRYRIAGPDALRPQKKGRRKTLSKSKNNKQNKGIEESSVDTSAEHVKELEDELLKLRIENAFLKEMRRLRLEDKAKMRERRLSLTVSEEDSN